MVSRWVFMVDWMDRDWDLAGRRGVCVLMGWCAWWFDHVDGTR